jgi:hypothetical protein
MTTKLKLIYLCYWINILALLFYLFIVVAALLRMHDFLNYVFYNPTFLNIRIYIGIPLIVLWIYNMVIWSRHDKHVGRFFLIFFLIGIYSPFYFRRIIKNGWQDKSNNQTS